MTRMKHRWLRTAVILIAGLCLQGIAQAQDSTGHTLVLIAYQSKHGSTRQYAEWIQKHIPSDLADIGQGEKPDVARYDIIVFGGYVRAGRIVIAPYMKEQWSALKGRKVVLFTTSGTPPEHPLIQKVYQDSLPEEVRRDVQYFPLPGRLLKKDLDFSDKVLIAIGEMMEKDEALKKNMAGDFDGVKPENLQPLIEYLREAMNHSRSTAESIRK